MEVEKRLKSTTCGQICFLSGELLARRSAGLRQKGRSLTPVEAQTLKGLGLIEGRAPRYFTLRHGCRRGGQKARYIHNRGLDKAYYRRPALDYLRSCGHAAHADMNSLLQTKLSDVLEAQHAYSGADGHAVR